MKNQVIAPLFVLSCLALSMPVMADDSYSHDNATEAPDANAPDAKAEKKSGRKKRQLMCKDCGKPETRCDCHGEEKTEAKKE